jgi:hypothetical protein
MTSISIPFSFDGGRLTVTQSPEKAAEQKIIDVMSTSAYERVMRSKYGVGTQTLVFDVLDELSFRDFKTEAMQTLAETVSNAQILDMVIASSNSVAALGQNDTTLAITIIYRLPLGSPRSVTVNLAIPGELTEDSTI